MGSPRSPGGRVARNYERQRSSRDGRLGLHALHVLIVKIPTIRVRVRVGCNYINRGVHRARVG